MCNLEPAHLSIATLLGYIFMTLLYLTVPLIGLHWKGMSEAELSICRDLGAVSGVAVTVGIYSSTDSYR